MVLISMYANQFFVSAILEPHVVDKYPLVTFPEYVWAMRWHNPGFSIIIQNSKMAAAKPELVTLKNKIKIQGVVSQLTDEI